MGVDLLEGTSVRAVGCLNTHTVGQSASQSDPTKLLSYLYLYSVRWVTHGHLKVTATNRTVPHVTNCRLIYLHLPDHITISHTLFHQPLLLLHNTTLHNTLS